MKSYYISYSQDGNNWVDIPTLYTGNKDRINRKTNNLPPDAVARFVRLRPDTWFRGPSLRWEIGGCDRKLEAVYEVGL